MTKLSDLLNSTGISARQAAELATKKKVTLPYGSISGYWSGKHPKQPSEPLLEALAEVTGISVRRLRRAAGAAEGEDTPWTPPAEANRLNARQRQAIEELILSIVSADGSADYTQKWNIRPPGQAGASDTGR